MTARATCRAPTSAACNGVLPLFYMAMDIFHHHDGIIHHQPDSDNQGEHAQQVDGKAQGIN